MIVNLTKLSIFILCVLLSEQERKEEFIRWFRKESSATFPAQLQAHPFGNAFMHIFNSSQEQDPKHSKVNSFLTKMIGAAVGEIARRQSSKSTENKSTAKGDKRNKEETKAASNLDMKREKGDNLYGN